MSQFDRAHTTSYSTLTCFTCCITSNRMSTNVSQHRYMIIDKVLDTVETVRDLALIVVHCLKFDAHIFYCACAWLELDFHLSSDVLSRNCKLLLKAYTSYARPILEYCSSVWSPHQKYLINKIESIQKIFTKRLPCLQCFDAVCWAAGRASGL